MVADAGSTKELMMAYFWLISGGIFSTIVIFEKTSTMKLLC